MPFQICHTSSSVSNSIAECRSVMAVAGGIHSELLLLLLLLFQLFLNEFSYESCFTDSSEEVFYLCRKS